MRIGAHVSIAGALPQAVHRAVRLGCECLQIFVGSPRQWQAVEYPAEDLAEFRRLRRAAGLEPLVAHASYLVNLASPDAAMRAAGIASLSHSMRAMEELDGLGVVTHIGSGRGLGPRTALRRVAAAVRQALRRTRRARLLLENSAGGTLGASFEELRAILELLEGHPRVGVCLDTAHLFAAGTDLRTRADVRAMLAGFDRTVGLDRLWLFHLNDSRSELGSRLDRHENIGKGRIGSECFRVLLGERRLAGLGGVLETPGFRGEGPDRQNMRTLRALRAAAPGRRAGASGAPRQRALASRSGRSSRRARGPGPSPSRRPAGGGRAGP